MGSSVVRGRANHEGHAAAISKIVACSPHRELIQAALLRITGSPPFRSSKRAQEFLTYVVDHALSGEFDHLKERSIGSAVFSREADYDTGTDAIVRVTASDVRKRLSHYYRQAGVAESVFIELPAGSYLPEIRIELDKKPIEAPVAEALPPQIGRLSPAWRIAAIAGWTVAVILFGIWAETGFFRDSGSLSHPLQELPWVALFEGGQSPRLVMSDSGMGALRLLRPFPVSLEDYANRRFLEPAPDLPSAFRAPWRELAQRQLTSVANARIAAGYAQLARSVGRKAVVSFARDLQLSDFHRGDNLILLGSDSANPWVELYQDQLNFQVRFDPVLQRQSIHMRAPAPGTPSDLPASVTTGTTGEAYATISLINGLDGRGVILIIQGTNMEGTDLAGELALTPGLLTTQLKGKGVNIADPTARFEVLFRLSATAGSTLASEVLATRLISKK
ncbi:MAG TPA: hypothetical protein VHZ07_07895 [Bryobacteraceae bacterium]|jgi:hypothetical protein|nr:hypothetical protein [Bryobacteraceae bacterium]